MQILRFTYPPKEQSSRNSPVLTPLSIIGEYVADQLGDDLRLFDVRDASVPVCVIPDVFDDALQPGVLVTTSLSGALRQYEIDGAHAAQSLTCRYPSSQTAKHQRPRRSCYRPLAATSSSSLGPSALARRHGRLLRHS
jgi:hypothetical protein